MRVFRPRRICHSLFLVAILPLSRMPKKWRAWQELHLLAQEPHLLARERQELADDPEHETAELAQIYVGRGVEPGLAREVAVQLMAKDALGTHAREELGITEITASRPVTAALASAASFAVGAALPLAVVFVSPTTWLAFLVTLASLGALALLGVVGALAGGAPLRAAVMRVVFWGAAAMALTAAIGAVVGRAV